MAEPLKFMYNPPFFDRLCPVLKDVIPQFEERKFIYRVFNKEWPDLELKQRTRQITRALNDFMPDEFPRAAEIIVAIADLLRKNKEQEQGYPLIFLPDYIERYGQFNLETSMKAIQEITKLVSAEFAIRPFIIKYPDQTMEQMFKWSTHQEASVRRLSSEGCRPRLPWAMRLPAFIQDPSPILPILENLKKDSSEYVRRSVANNLNDIAKDHPELVLKTVKKWKGEIPATQWIIKHGCRTLLKQGSEAALNLHGFNPTRKSVVRELKALKKIKIGECLNFSFVFCNQDKKHERFRLEYAIHYITSTGKISMKVFKIGEYTVEPAEVVYVKRKQSFKDFTTRKHFKGTHRLRILVNGKEKASVGFLVY